MNPITSDAMDHATVHPSSAGLNRLPHFVIGGLAKSGTSSVYQYLGQHPQIFLSPIRVTNFFGLGEQPAPTYGGPVSTRTVYAPTLPHFHALFADAKHEIAFGEGSSFFNFTRRAAERMHHYIPNVRIIVLLRQPAEKAYSQYLYARRVGWEPESAFQAAWDDESRRLSESWFPFLRYRESSLYAEKLGVFFDLFSPDQIQVSLFDDFRRNPTKVVRELYRFLGVDPDFEPDTTVNRNPACVGLWPWLRSPHNAKMARVWRLIPARLRKKLFLHMSRINTMPSVLDAPLRMKLTAEFRSDILLTQSIIGKDLSSWLDTSDRPNASQRRNPADLL